MQLIPLLNRLSRTTKSLFPRINSGGCCVFAALVGEELRKKGINVHVVVGAWNHNEVAKPIEEVRQNIPDAWVADHRLWRAEEIYFVHLGLEIETRRGRVLYDANGVQANRGELDGCGLYNGRMKLDDAKALADNPHAWNDTFDRSDIPRLKFLVESEIEHLTVEPV